MPNWYLVYTKPSKEDFVADKFIERGFDVVNPKIRERKYIRRKLREVISPLFPCYIFVRFDVPKDYHLVKYTRGVRRIVGVEGMPSVVPEWIIETVIEKTKNGPITVKPNSLKPGEKVLIKGGPFEGLDAVFEKELKGQERVCILLNAINARIVIDRALLARAC